MRSRLTNDTNLERVAVLELLGPRNELINVPASVDETASRKIGLLGRKPESKLAREVDLKKALACTIQFADRVLLTTLPRNGVCLEPISFRARREDSAWMVAGDANTLVGVLLLKVHENVHEGLFARSVTCHAWDALVRSSVRDGNDILLLDQGLRA